LPCSLCKSVEGSLSAPAYWLVRPYTQLPPGYLDARALQRWVLTWLETTKPRIGTLPLQPIPAPGWAAKWQCCSIVRSCWRRLPRPRPERERRGREVISPLRCRSCAIPVEETLGTRED